MNFIDENQTDILCLVKHHHNVVYRIFNIDTVNDTIDDDNLTVPLVDDNKLNITSSDNNRTKFLEISKNTKKQYKL
jgi:hypothetical protein